MHSRRIFLRKSALSLPGFYILNSKSQRKKVKKPIVISTWDSGLPVNKVAWEVLKQTNSQALDAVEAGARSIEDKIDCCVGLGGNPDRDGKVTLDACIMDHQFNCGSVAFLERIKHPISVARKIMEDSPHVMLVGEGAQQFAVENGFKLASDKLSESAEKTYKEWLKKSEYKPIINIERSHGGAGFSSTPPPFKLSNGVFNHDTMGLIALDQQKRLAGACTTSGMAFKMRGRVGDSPIIGSGLYVDNEVGAVTGSGQGEEVIRISGAHAVVEFMRQGKSPAKACKLAIERIVEINPQKAKNFQVGFIALSKYGEFGGYAVQPGFVYAVTHNTEPGRLFESKSYF